MLFLLMLLLGVSSSGIWRQVFCVNHMVLSWQLFKIIFQKVFVVTFLTIMRLSYTFLQRAWGKPVLDRVGLIIQIFNAHAQTKEAKLQVILNFYAIFLVLLYN